MLCGYVVNELLDKNCLSYSGASEETDLSSLCIGADKVYDLDACFEDLR